MKKSVLISSLLLFSIGIGYFSVNFHDKDVQEPSYKPVALTKKNSNKKSWNDAAELYHSLYQDETTGKIDYHQLGLAKQEVLTMMMNKALKTIPSISLMISPLLLNFSPFLD